MKDPFLGQGYDLMAKCLPYMHETRIGSPAPQKKLKCRI